MSHKIHIAPQNKVIKAEKNEILSDVLIKAGIPLSTYCNKKGLCGKCLIKIMSGSYPPLSDLEKDYRLACQFRVTEDISILIPEKSLLRDIATLKTGISMSVRIDPAVKKYFFHIKGKNISTPQTFFEYIKSEMQIKELIVPDSITENAERLLHKTPFGITAVFYEEKELLDLESGDTTEKSYGLAVDIGTTTVDLELIDLNTGKTLGYVTALNGQVRFGADIISRISHAYSGPKQQEELQKAIVSTLNQMIGPLLTRNHIDPHDINEVVAAGNTVMNHLFLGKPVHTLAVSPFTPSFTSLPPVPASSLGLKINDSTRVYISPNIKSFVGGDISAGLIASDFSSRSGSHLFIDLGTNGEIVLKIQDKIFATSTAAGPAFEGMNLSSGMLALPGAIYKAEFKEGLNLYTIDDQPAVGICGTGLIDLLSVFLRQGNILSSGKIANSKKEIQVTGSIVITQKDIRDLQLATAAIKTGIQLMLEENNLDRTELDGLLIAGAFGTYMNIQNAMLIGLLPCLTTDKIVYVGNASLAGAKAMLISDPIRKKTETLVKEIRFISLAERASFQDKFLKALEFQSI